MLSASALRLGYDGHPVLDGVSLDVAPGDAVALLGPNGAGKTTLLRALAGLLRPLAGDVRLCGRAIAAWRRREVARRLAYVPQEHALLFPFRVIDVVLMGRYSHARFATFETREDLAAARVALEAVDLADRGERRFDELSGGERRRALLAQALAQECPVVLLDEPTASLDVAHALAFLRSIETERARRGLCVVIATHDLGAAARSCARALLLSGGRVAADGATLGVLASPECARAFGAPLHVGRVPETGRPFCVPA